MIILVCLLIGAVFAVLAFVVADDLKTAPSVMPVDPVSGPYDFDFDDHADEAIALLGDDFTEWEEELSKR